MYKKQLVENLKGVERIASTSKFGRMLNNPFKYIYAILFREMGYKRTKEEKKVVSDTFFGIKMNLLLPSSTDIYLTKGKSHDSEIRLAKLLIKQLNIGDTFIDVGAHYGYFSLLGAKLVGETGNVQAFEAAPKTYRILEDNQSLFSHLTAHNLAVSDQNGDLSFYEFPNLYAEYNSLDVSQFQEEEWFKRYSPKKISIESIVLDEFLPLKNVIPNFIKIDVEGAEYQVVKGLENTLSNCSPIVVLEYLSESRGNDAHRRAEQLLTSLGYAAFFIDKEGDLQSVKNVESYLREQQLDSDNIAFVKH